MTTEDNYILTVHRISAEPFDGERSKGKKVMFLQHGIIDCSTVWILNEPELAPAF